MKRKGLWTALAALVAIGLGVAWQTKRQSQIDAQMHRNAQMNVLLQDLLQRGSEIRALDKAYMNRQHQRLLESQFRARDRYPRYVDDTASDATERSREHMRTTLRKTHARQENARENLRLNRERLREGNHQLRLLEVERYRNWPYK